MRSDYGDESYKPNSKQTDNSEPIEDKIVILERAKIERSIAKSLSSKKDLSAIPEIIALKKKYYDLEKPSEKYWEVWG